jgi:hypothetical protein
MSCSTSVTLKRGNTFGCNFVWTPGASGPANLSATTIASTVKDAGGAEYDLTVTIAAGGLSFTTNYVGDTSGWALGLAKWDVKFTFPGSTISRSETFRVNVIESVTA